MKKLLLMSVTLVLMAFVSHGALAQTVTGKVVSSEDNIGIPGVNVLIKGTSTGVVTDFDGNYRVEVSSSDVLVFSYVSFETQEVAVGNQSVIDVTLEIDMEQLAEVIVTGYTSQGAKEIAAAVATVDMDEAIKVPMANAAEAMQGRVSGVTVTNNGAPGSSPTVRIRGYGTPNSNNPLYIIDGVQTDDPDVLATINPGDIDQMNVLKDGAAAIYGSRAANGVVIITTKTGSVGRSTPVLTFDMYYGVQNVTNLPELLNAEQHGQMIFRSQQNDGNTPSHPQYGSGASPVVPSSLQGTGIPPTTVNPNGTKWFDEIFQSAPMQNYALSLSKGGKMGRYMMSVSYLDQEGIQLHTGFNRLSTRLNSEFSLSDRVIFGEHMNISWSNQRFGNQVQSALRSSPLIPVRDNDGNFAGTYNASAGLGNNTNPVANLTRAQDNYNKRLRFIGDVYANVEIIDNLNFKTSYGMNYQSFHNRFFNALNPEHSEPVSTNTLGELYFNQYEWVWSNTLNYSNRFGDHNIDALIGIESVYNTTKGHEVQRTGYLFEDPDFYLLNNGSGAPVVTNAFDAAYSLFSVFANANYSYKGKYLFGATVRSDKTSRFSSNNQSAVFPAFNAGWVISEEGFFNASWFSSLKLKGSWGQIGNQSLPASNPDVNISTLDEGQAYYAFNGTSASVGARLNSVGNPNLKWETSVSTNIGLSTGFFDNKLNFEIDWFTITTEDLISQDNSLISTTAIDAGAPYVNIGSVKNTGIDINLGYQDATESGFTYGANVVFSSYKNEVTELITDFYSGSGDFRGGAVTRTEVGQPISSFYGKIVESVDANGRFVYTDVNGDGNINDDDRTYIGSPHADFTYGINLNLGFKGFDLSAFFNGSQGNEVYNYMKIYTDFPTFFNGNRSTRVLSGGEGNADLIPGLSETVSNSETQANSYFVEDGSFFRLKNLQLGYTLPSDIAAKVKMSSARIYIQGTNLFTATKYQGLEPEVGPYNGQTLTLGVDNGSYPQSQMFSVGLNLKF